MHRDGQEAKPSHDPPHPLFREMGPAALLHNPMPYPPVAPPALALPLAVEDPLPEQAMLVRPGKSLPLVVVGGIIQGKDLPKESELVVGTVVEGFSDASLDSHGGCRRAPAHRF